MTVTMMNSEETSEIHEHTQPLDVSAQFPVMESRIVSHLSSITEDASGPVQKILSTQIPLARIRRIMKEDEDVTICSSEVVTIISMAAELFSEYLAKKAFEYSRKDKRKTLLLRDITKAVKESDDLFFLTDAMIELITSIETFKREKALSDPVVNEEDNEETQNLNQLTQSMA